MYYQDTQRDANTYFTNEAKLQSTQGMWSNGTKIGAPPQAQSIASTRHGEGFLKLEPWRWKLSKNKRKKKRRKRPLKPELTPGPIERTCELCNITVGSKNWDDHLKGKRHKVNKERLNKCLSVNPATGRRRCTLCEVEFRSSLEEQSHVKGNIHTRKMEESLRGECVTKSDGKDAGEFGSCPTCSVNYTSIEMKDKHLAGIKHAKACWAKEIKPGLKALKKSIWPQKRKTKKRAAKKRKRVRYTRPKNASQLEIKLWRSLKKQEEAYLRYENIVKNNPSEGHTLYLEYKALYQEYEAAYEEFEQKEGTYN